MCVRLGQQDCITLFYLLERAGLCSPSLYFNFAKSKSLFIPDESRFRKNNGKLQDGVKVYENYKCGKGAKFTNGHIGISGKTFQGDHFFVLLLYSILFEYNKTNSLSF